MNDSFKEYFERLTPIDTPNELPINHIFDVKFLMDFLSQKHIPNDYLGVCDVFGDYYLYFFYGRPAFKLNELNAYPACFVFHGAMKDYIKIFPFDSGAFAGNKMKKYFSNSGLNEFDIEKCGNIHKVVNFFYPEKEVGYYVNNPGVDNRETNNYAVCQYHKMITDRAGDSLDERKSTIEVIFKKNMNMANLALGVIPKNYRYDYKGEILSSDDIENKLKNTFACEIMQYGFTPSVKKNYSKIYELVKEYIFRYKN